MQFLRTPDTRAKALEFLQTPPLETVLLHQMTEAQAREAASRVSLIITDADGTVVPEGHTEFPPAHAQYITELIEVGVETILLTGKPYEEVRAVADSLPKGCPLKIVYEKGGYYLAPDEVGQMQRHYLLSSPKLEAEVAELRRQFEVEKAAIEAKYEQAGRRRVVFGWSGSGQQKSVIGIDIYAGEPPANYSSIVGVGREAMKVKDPELLAAVEADLGEFVARHKPGWRLMHLGNGNSEIAPGGIEKDLAIRQMPEFQAATGVLVMGDSGNDRAMFAMRQDPRVLAALVLHREASLGLVDEADMVSFGMANAAPLFELVLTAKRRG